MTIGRLVLIWCDCPCRDCDQGEEGEALQDAVDDTATDLLRRAGWATIRGRHYCSTCKHRIRR